MRRRYSSVVLPAAAILLAAAAGGCVIETVAVPLGRPLVQVHGILNTTLGTQIVMVERVLGGMGEPNERGGVAPISGAEVVVTGPLGRTYIAREVVDTIERTSPGQPIEVIPLTRRYEFSTDLQNALIPGHVYHLRVTTPDGEVVTGSTRIPTLAPVNFPTTRHFNRDRDTLRLNWVHPSGTAAFWLRVDGVGTAYDQFLNTDRVELTGSLRSLDFGQDRSAVFVPGFVAPITVAAVDQNTYNYFRSISDPFTGLGRVNHLEGGYGVFGSLTIVNSTAAVITADIIDPIIEGTWNLTTPDGGHGGRPEVLRLYVDRERPHTPGDTVSTLFGSWSPAQLGRQPVIGSRIGNHVEVSLMNRGVISETMRGTVAGDILTLWYDEDGSGVTFRRSR